MAYTIKVNQRVKELSFGTKLCLKKLTRKGILKMPSDSSGKSVDFV
uniref:Uncharacterized protein n=1 Tax=Tetranychus urticae TaxID=32264 RepID=T1KK89_TETUR